VNGKLAEDGANNVDVEDVVLRALFGESFNGLKDISTDMWASRKGRRTFAREMDRKQTLIIIPEIVT
jgi:hypothetical protein